MRRIGICRLALLLVMLACTLGCRGDRDQGRRLVLTGSSTVAPLASQIAKRFEAANKGVRVDVQSGGSSRGVADTRAGTAQIGMVSRALKAKESDLQPFTIAKDGICMIAHQDNPISHLSDEQVAGIYTGRYTNWREVGGRPGPITVVNKAEGRSTLELFLAYFGLKNSEIRAHVVIGDNEQGIKTVTGNPGSIGYVSIGTAEYDMASGTPIKLLPVGGITASLANVRSGRFPLSRPLNLVTKSAPTGLAKRFIEYARSPAVHDLVEKQYFVPLDI